MNNVRTSKKFQLLVRTSTLKNLIVLVILNIPGFLINRTTIYHVTQKLSGGDFAYLDYTFTIFELFLVIWALFIVRKKDYCIKFTSILFLIFIKDIFLALLGKTNPFSLHSYEMYLSLLVGICSCSIVCKNTDDDAEQIYNFLDLLIYVNFLYQVLFVVTGKIALGDRVNSISMGYGDVGFLCALHIMFSLLVREKSKKVFWVVIVGFMSIILSGSRFSLLIALLGIVIFSRYILESIDKRLRGIIIFVSVLLIALLFAVLFNPALQSKYAILKRMTNLFQNGSVIQNTSQDESFTERILSMNVGWNIIHDHPFGISNSYIDIQSETIRHGFFSFPHSFILSYYLLWGPALIVCIIWLIVEIVKSYEMRLKGAFRFLIFFLVCVCIYGGVETAPKFYTYVLIALSTIKIMNHSLEQYSGYEET